MLSWLPLASAYRREAGAEVFEVSTYLSGIGPEQIPLRRHPYSGLLGRVESHWPFAPIFERFSNDIKATKRSQTLKVQIGLFLGNLVL